MRAEIPHEWPPGRFDLIVLSEVLYFLSAEDITLTACRTWESLKPGGSCLLVNWTGPIDLPVDGARAVEIFSQSAAWLADIRRREGRYRFDRFRKP